MHVLLVGKPSWAVQSLVGVCYTLDVRFFAVLIQRTLLIDVRIVGPQFLETPIWILVVEKRNPCGLEPFKGCRTLKGGSALLLWVVTDPYWLYNPSGPRCLRNVLLWGLRDRQLVWGEEGWWTCSCQSQLFQAHRTLEISEGWNAPLQGKIRAPKEHDCWYPSYLGP